jgi:hypothetical protein
MPECAGSKRGSHAETPNKWAVLVVVGFGVFMLDTSTPIGVLSVIGPCAMPPLQGVARTARGAALRTCGGMSLRSM